MNQPKANNYPITKLPVLSFSHILLILVCTFIHTIVYSQQRKDSLTVEPQTVQSQQEAQAQANEHYSEIIPSSPNAAALEKYGKIPIGYHTGVPQISVPLGQVTEGSLNVPISLSYHASGLKVMETSSWIGAGWSLIAAGAITRSVQGLPDEKQAFGRGFAQQFGHYDDLGFGSYVNDDENHPDYGTNNFAQTIGQGEVDGEADRYYIQVPGFSSKFYFNDDRSVIFEEAADVKVTPYKGSNGGFARWEVILPSGIRYTFAQQSDRPEAAAERTYTYREEQGIGINFRAAVTSWLLTEVASADRQDIITFHYVPEEYGFHTLVPSIGAQGAAPTRIKSSVRGWRLSEIRHAQGKILFQAAATPRQDLANFSLWDGGDNPNQEAYALKSIEWRDRNGNCSRKFELTTSYFNDVRAEYYIGSYPVDSDQKRLKLDQVQEVGCGTPSKPPYVFTYYQASEVPRRLSYAQDHWGFFNGATGNPGMLPSGSGVITSTGIRESSFPAMRAGSLRQIQYPTGGTTTFDYEANQVWRRYQEDVIASSASATHQTSGSQSITKTVTLTQGEYIIAYTVSSSEEESKVTLEGSQNDTRAFGGSFSKGPTTYSDVMTLGGEYTLLARGAQDNNSTSGSMKIFAFSTEQRSGDFMVGGLRIKTITNDPGDGEDLVQRYKYTKNNTFGSGQVSSAALYGRPEYRSYIRNDYTGTVGYRNGAREVVGQDQVGCFQDNNPNGPKLTSISGIFPMEEVQGYHIGYEVVTEYEPDGGHTVYNFNTSSSDSPFQPIAVYQLPETCDAETQNYPPAPPAYDPQAGRLYQKIVMGADGKRKQLTVYDDVFETEAEEVPGLIYGNVGNAPFITFYKLRSYKLTQQTETTYLYEQSDESKWVKTVARTEFGADKHALPTVRTKEGNNGTHRQAFSYPSDFTRSTRISGSSRTTYQQALQANQNSFIQTTSASTCRFATSCWYRAFKAKERLDLAARGVYAQRNTTERAQAVANLANDYNNASPEYRAIINLQANNQVGQPLETTSFEDNAFLEAYYQQYKDKKSTRNETSSEVYPAESYLIQRTVSFNPLQIVSGDVATDNDYELGSSQRYEQGKMVEVRGRDGVPTTYLWGYNYTLPVAKIIGATYLEASAKVNLSALQSMDGATLRSELGKLRSLANAQATTYTHDPLVGVTSQTDPNGRTMIYHYDNLNRLEWMESQEGHVVQKFDYQYAQP